MIVVPRSWGVTGTFMSSNANCRHFGVFSVGRIATRTAKIETAHTRTHTLSFQLHPANDREWETGGLAAINNHHFVSLSYCTPRSLCACLSFIALSLSCCVWSWQNELRSSPPPWDGGELAGTAVMWPCPAVESACVARAPSPCCCIGHWIISYCWRLSMSVLLLFFDLYCSSWELDGSVICGNSSYTATSTLYATKHYTHTDNSLVGISSWWGMK